MTAILIATALSFPAFARAEPLRFDLGPSVTEAAERFGLPRPWIVGVMRRESGFDARAVSPAGALGLMQLMPGTYGDLRRRYGLGADPLQPRDNILAGTAYLRELYDRFGADGFLAAYNAGPERYIRSLIGAETLPGPTPSYVRQLRLDLGPALAASAAQPPSVFAVPDVAGTPGLTPHIGDLFAAVSAPSGGTNDDR